MRLILICHNELSKRGGILCFESTVEVPRLPPITRALLAPTRLQLRGGMGEPIKCTLVASFAARQAIIMAAVLLFVLYTWIQIRRGVEKRSLTTLVADASKQAGQQAFGGAMMVVLGVLLAHHKYDSLAWYAAECAPQPRLAAERDRYASDEVCAAARWQIRSR